MEANINPEAAATLHGAIIQAEATVRAATIQADATTAAANTGLLASALLAGGGVLVLWAAYIQSGPERERIRATKNALRAVVVGQLEQIGEALVREHFRIYDLHSAEEQGAHVDIAPRCPPLPPDFTFNPTEAHGLLGQRFLNALVLLQTEYGHHREWCTENNTVKTGEQDHDPDAVPDITDEPDGGAIVTWPMVSTTMAYRKRLTNLLRKLREAEVAVQVWHRRMTLRAMYCRSGYPLGRLP